MTFPLCFLLLRSCSCSFLTDVTVSSERINEAVERPYKRLSQLAKLAGWRSAVQRRQCDVRGGLGEQALPFNVVRSGMPVSRWGLLTTLHHNLIRSHGSLSGVCFASHFPGHNACSYSNMFSVTLPQ